MKKQTGSRVRIGRSDRSIGLRVFSSSGVQDGIRSAFASRHRASGDRQQQGGLEDGARRFALQKCDAELDSLKKVDLYAR
ncbi:hypothetical protein QTI66_29615 [Variovorax sp. J22R133]|uniref:hypothetical protein n=1 Tax=Variovorax brevis TaxID=3053503 RepID=UPI002574F510|nr:hypothetical protein [Variovorax sp. J22R133]MDM0116320.1 hypothetical protein [Variovorax sp. J22R133]